VPGDKESKNNKKSPSPEKPTLPAYGHLTIPEAIKIAKDSAADKVQITDDKKAKELGESPVLQ
jgi:hypothetical protein